MLEWLFFIAPVVAILLVTRYMAPTVPRKTLFIGVALFVMIRIGFYVAFRLFDERDVFFTMGVLLVVAVLVGIVFGSIAVWKQMGRNSG